MATIRAYTTIEQSRKLAEILPHETADMCYKCIEDDPYDIVLRPFSEWREEYKGLLVNKEADVIPCWSLAAMLGVLPKIHKLKPILDLEENSIQYSGIDLYVVADNLVDACIEMIEKLHELKKL